MGKTAIYMLKWTVACLDVCGVVSAHYEIRHEYHLCSMNSSSVRAWVVTLFLSRFVVIC